MNNHFFIEALLPSPTSHYSQTTTSTNCCKSCFCRISNINTIESQIFGVCTIMITLNHQIKTPIGFDVGRVQTTSFLDLPLFTINHFNKLWQKLLCRISNIDTIEFQIYGVCTILIALNHQIKTPIAFGVGKVQTLHQCHKLIGYWMFLYCMSVCYIAISYIGHVLSWLVLS